MNKLFRNAIVAGILLGGPALLGLTPAAHAQDQAATPQGGNGQGGQGGGGRGRGRGGRGRGADLFQEDAPAPVPKAPASTKKISSAEQFFIVASIDQAKSQILLKYPTEVTLLVNVDGKTQYTDDSKNPIKLSNFRTGDTVWVRATGTEDNPTALSIRMGQLTMAELHSIYLDYPVIK